MTTEQVLASRLLTEHGNRVHIADLNSFDQELFDRVLNESDQQTQGDWICEGAINVYCDRGSVLIYGSNAGL